MEQFTIYFDPSSNKKWGVNSDFYDIYIMLGDFAFPGKGWTDLALYCIDDWSQGFIKIISKDEKCIVGSFYDGNYYYNLLVENDNQMKIQLIDGDENDKIIKESYINISQAVSSIIETIDNLTENLEKPDKIRYWETMKNSLSNLLKNDLHKPS